MFKQNAPSQSMVSAAVPGKLYVAGEYAVLENGQPAILIALNQYLKVEIAFSEDNFSQLSTNQVSLSSIQARKEGSKWLLFHEEINNTEKLWEDWKYVLTAIDTCHDLLPLYNLTASNYRIRILSQLTSEDGRKYGLGSSGAVTAGMIQAVLKLHGLEAVDSLSYFKLAALTLLKLGSRGSFGDLASNLYHGWIYYIAPDRSKLLEKLFQKWTTVQMLTNDSVWEGLVIQPLNVSNELRVLIGWTQSPASTENLVAEVQKQAKDRPQAYKSFLSSAKETVNSMKKALESSQWEVFFQEVMRYRQLLADLSTAYELTIETSDLNQLIEIAHSQDFYAKSSGAGGGDCGLAFGLDYQKVATIHSAWEKAGIEPLHVEVALNL